LGDKSAKIIWLVILEITRLDGVRNGWSSLDMLKSAWCRRNGGVGRHALNDSIGWLVRLVEGCLRIARNSSAEFSSSGRRAWWIHGSSHRVNRGRARMSNIFTHANTQSLSSLPFATLLHARVELTDWHRE